jgi:serine/threonine-protein kinase PpkA
MTESDNHQFPHIAGYDIKRHLGRGGMADVYLGTQLSLSRPVAIKVVSSERAQGNETITRFEHEAQTIARLDHPHIVKIFDVGRTGDARLYFTMPYLPRGDLSTRKLHGEEASILGIVRALCSALAYAHKLGIVHRDVKPENVLFDQADRPLLADFGIALSTHDIVRVTREGSTIGSSGYMSPEQARGLILDGRADLYSLGVVTYELLSGDLPFNAPDTLAMALAHVEQPIPRLPPRLKRWQAFIDKAMAKNTADRFQSAAQMQIALDAIDAEQKNEGIVAAPRVMRPQFGLIAAFALITIGAGMLTTAIMHLRESPAPVPSEAGVVEPAQSVPALKGETSTAMATADAPTDVKTSEGMIAADASNVEVIAPSSAPSADIFSANQESASSTTTQQSTRAANVSAASTPVGEPLANPPELVPGTAMRDRGGPELAFVPAARSAGVHGFALARYEVSRGEYAAFVQATGRAASKCLEPKQLLSRLKSLNWKEPGFDQTDRHPVVCVSWNDAAAYAQWLSGRTHAQYRLPTRAEWLHAARSVPVGIGVCLQGNLAGRGMLSLHIGGALCKHGFDRTAPAGRFKPNALGIYDMVGNVSEWSLDCKEFGIDAEGHCVEHLFSGTSWRDDAGTNNLEATGDAAADLGYTSVGIRLLRKLEANNMPPIER